MSSGKKSSLRDARYGEKPRVLYESYRPGGNKPTPHVQTVYDSYRPGPLTVHETYRPDATPRLAQNFRRDEDPRDDRYDLQDRHVSLGNRRDGARPEHRSPPRRRPSSPVLQRPKQSPSLQPLLYRNKTWIRSITPPPKPLLLPFKAGVSDEVNGARSAPVELFPRPRCPLVKQSVKQTPHIFIPAPTTPVDQSTINQLENSRAKLVPTKSSGRHVFMDDTGYFLTFPGGNQGRCQQAMWLKTNERTFPGMISYPDGHTANAVQPTSSRNLGGPDTSTASLMDMGTPLSDQHTELASLDEVNFSIKGAASGGIKKLVTPQSAGTDEFIIRGAAATSLPHSSTRSPSVDAAFAPRHSQHARNDLLHATHIYGTDVLSNKLLARTSDSRQQSLEQSTPRQDRDDAESTTSGMSRSVISSSKTSECHVCHARIGQLIKCSCNRRYHRHCHTDPPIPEHLSSEWQCRRCVRKGIPVKRSISELPSPDLESRPHKKQRLLNGDSQQQDKPINNASDVPRPASKAEPASISRPASISELASLPSLQQHIELSGGAILTIAPEHQVEILDNDDELDDLVAESFAIKPSNGEPKKGGKLRVTKHRISVLQPQAQNENETTSAHILDEQSANLAVTSIASLPDGVLNAGSPTVEHRKIAEIKVQYCEGANDVNDLPRLQSNTNPTPSANGNKAKTSRSSIPKTGEGKIGKIRCTSCRIRAVPPNPFRRTICLTCKDDAGSTRDELKATDNNHTGVSEATHAVDLGSVDGMHMAADIVEKKGQKRLAATVNSPVATFSTLVAAAEVVASPAAVEIEAVQKSVASEDQRPLESLHVTELEIPAALDTHAIAIQRSPNISPCRYMTAAPLLAASYQATANEEVVSHETQSPAPPQTGYEESSLSELSSESADEDDVALATLIPKRALDVDDVTHRRQSSAPPQQDHEHASFPGSTSDSTDEDDVALATPIPKRALNPNLKPKLESTRPASNRGKIRQTQSVRAKGQFDLGDSFQRPKGTYARLIHMAICDAPGGRLRSYEVTQWIADNIPGYKFGEGSWASSIKSTLIFKSDPCSKTGIPTLVRYGPGGSEDWYELLPAWKGKVDRWDAVLARPVPPLEGSSERSPPATEISNALLGELHANGSASEPGSKPPSTGILKSIEGPRKSRGRQPARSIPLKDLMEIDSESDADAAAGGNESSDSGPFALAAHRQLPAEIMDIDDPLAGDVNETFVGPGPAQRSPGRRSVAGHTDPDDHHAKLAAARDAGITGRLPGESSHSNLCAAPRESLSIHDITIGQVLACRPAAMHAEFAKAWPSLVSKKDNFDYDAQRAKINARRSRKRRFGQQKPVDVDKLLATAGPSQDSPWPPIDNSLGLTQEQLGDEMTLVPCQNWDEFFGTTEEVQPCIMDGKLAYRAVGEKSRSVYKTSI